MEKNRKGPETIDEYIKAFPRDIQERLRAMRKTIHAAAPEAEERISYQMPTFYLRGNLVHFAAFRSHIGFYPVPSGILAFKKELAAYATSKGGVQFPLDQPLPLALLARIVKFRVAENMKNHRKKLENMQK
jgi:uncharacterized protein YdhG (YjbR/CyaY superfamily)